MAALAQSYPRGLDSIEGPNEVNNFPVEWGGKKNHESAQGYQDALYARAKEYPLLAKLPVYNFTDYPSHAGKADHANIHPYPKGGQQPRQTIADNVAAELKVQPGRPWVITEGGYYTLPGPHGWGGLDESTHAKLMLNYYLDAIEQGAQRIYAYQLLDAYPDKPGTDQEKHFGFFDIQYKPKPAASAVRTLLMLVHDNGENAGSFTPEPLAYTIEGLPASARSLMLQKSDGWRFLVVWNEPAIWDNKQFKPIAAHGTEISIKLSEPRAIATVNDVIAGQQALATLAHTDTIPLHLTDTPLLVALSPQ
jgi:hypothetical protein